MTAAHFAANDEDTADLLTLVADVDAPVGRDAPAQFLAACEADAKAHGGRVSVSRVSAALPDDMWSAFTGNGKPMRRLKGVWVWVGWSE